MTAQSESIRALIGTSFGRNWIPGVALWSMAIALLGGYLYWTAAREALDNISTLKEHYGYLFSAASTSLFGGLIPFAVHCMRGEYKTSHRYISCFLFFALFWAWKGAEIDAFYRFQAVLWGPGYDPPTIAKKVSFDMFVFSSIYAVPCIGIFSTWKDKHFSFSETRRLLRTKLYQKRIAAMIVTNWLIWIPAVSVVYAMPAPLQVFMFNLVLCFWVLIVSILSQTD